MPIDANKYPKLTPMDKAFSNVYCAGGCKSLNTRGFYYQVPGYQLTSTTFICNDCLQPLLPLKGIDRKFHDYNINNDESVFA